MPMPTAKIFCSSWRLLTTMTTTLAIVVGVFGDRSSAQQAAGATLSINDLSVTEGHRFQKKLATFTVMLANVGALASDARVTWATADGSATAPGTVYTSTGAISIPTAGVASPYPSLMFPIGGPATQTVSV
jgi:hypothetical protein